MRFNSCLNCTILRATLLACVCVMILICPNALALTSQNAPQNDAVRDRWVATLDAKRFTVAFQQVPIVQALTTIAQKQACQFRFCCKINPLVAPVLTPLSPLTLNANRRRRGLFWSLFCAKQAMPRKANVVGKQTLEELKLVQSRACFERARWSVAHTQSRILVSRRRTFKRHQCKVAAIQEAVQAEVLAAQQVHHSLHRRMRLAIKK